MLVIDPAALGRAAEALLIAATTAKTPDGLCIIADTPMLHGDAQRVGAITWGAVVALLNGAACGDGASIAAWPPSIDLATRAVVTRHMVADGLVDRAALEADPLWERDAVSDNWFKRTPEYVAARDLALAQAKRERPEAETALAKVLFNLDGELPQQCDGPAAPAVARTPYVVIDSGPRRRSYGDAISAWRDALREHVAVTRGDRLWWRERPEIQCDVCFGETVPSWGVYSRLAITASPHVQAAK